MRSLSSATWEMMPTMRLPPDTPTSAASACCSASLSSEPKPSSTNMASSCTPPAVACTSSDRPSASDREAANVSPPESVLTLRAVPL